MMEVTNLEALKLLPDLAVFFDDEIGTIEPHMQRARSLNVFPVVAKSVPELLSLMLNFRDDAIFFLDMHVPGVNDLGVIQCSDLETNDGSSFATAMYSAFLGISKQKSIRYANILSGRPIETAAYQVLSELEDHNFVVEDIEKGDYLKYDAVLRKYLSRQDRKIRLSEHDPVNGSENETRQVTAVVEVLSELGLERPLETAVQVMGYPANEDADCDYLIKLAGENLAQRQGDIRMRIDLFVYILSAVSSSLGKSNIPAQRAWLCARNETLDGKTPLSLMCSTDINDLALVAANLKRVLS